MLMILNFSTLYILTFSDGSISKFQGKKIMLKPFENEQIPKSNILSSHYSCICKNFTHL